jgi:beta-lactamase regulating signal transducer with metallopeptidase domain
MIESVVRVLGLTLLHSLWQGALVALVVATLLTLLPRAAARARYAILCAGLLLHLAAPAVTAAALARGGAQVATPAAATPAGSASIGDPGATVAAGSTDVLGAVARGVAGLDRFLPAAVALWLLGVLAGGVRFLGGWLALRRVVGRAAAAPVAEQARRLAERMGIARSVRVLVSREVAGPFSMGCLRPAIVLPLAMMTGFDPGHVNAILAHELAHVRRWDYLVGLVQSLALTLLYHHPATWWLDRRLRAEREHCCDDLAVATCGDRLGYVHALAELESRRLGLSSLACAATDGSLRDRIERLLGVRRPVSPSGWIPAVALTALVALAGALHAGERDNLSLAARWDEAASRGDVVIGWRIRSRINDGRVVVSSTDGTTRAPGTRLADLIGAKGDDARGVAVLVTVARGEIVGVRLRSLSATIALGDRRLVWLGTAPDAASLELVDRVMAATRDRRLRSELGAALSLHDDLAATLDAVGRVLDKDRDAGVRAETLAWLGRSAAAEPAVTALLMRGLNDRSALVRDEALTTLLDDPGVDPRALLRAAVYEDVRAEVLERLARAGENAKDDH